MQNVQNAEIQQRVINLVELYRTKVGKESQIAKDAKAEQDYWEMAANEVISDMLSKGETINGFGCTAEGPHTEIWAKHLMVNEQLLGHFYAEVAGENAEKDILDQLLPYIYDKTVFTEKEEAFLANHFKEMVNYIILTPCDESLDWVSRHDGKDALTIPVEVLELINSCVKISSGSRIYYPHAGFAQFTNLFEGCKFLCDDVNTWMRVAFYANNVDAEIIENNAKPTPYDAVVSYMYRRIDSDNGKSFKRIYEAYKSLPLGGKLVLLCPSAVLWKKEANTVNLPQDEFREQLVRDNSIVEIVQLPSVMSPHLDSYDWCLLIAEKGNIGNTATMIDARFAFKETEHSLSIDDVQAMGDEIIGRQFITTESGRMVMLSGPFGRTFDNKALKEMIDNNGILAETGLRKMVHVHQSQLHADNLMPEIYVIERPSETESPVPLSTLCDIESTLVRDVQFDLPENTPWIHISDLTPLYTGDMDMSGIRKADCPNNPAFVEGSKDYAFDKDGKFIDSFWEQVNTKKGNYVYDYRHCTYFDGNFDAVLCEGSTENGLRVAIVRKIGLPYAVNEGILVFVPKEGIDAEQLAATLRLPIVYRQILAFQKYGLGNHLDDILVPTDKRIICDETRRMKREESVTNELGDKVQAMKMDYINEVSMRKHDMGQKVFDLINTEDLMRYYVENRETESDLWPQIEEQLDHFRTTINELSDMLDQLSQEERFGTPELLDLNGYFAGLQHSSNINGFKLSYLLDRDSILNLQLSRMKDKDMVDVNSMKAMPTVFMAKNDLQRIVSNILTNAQKHGFMDSNRKDYEVNIRLEFNTEKGMYQIDFRNNGKPLPDGMNKMRYGIKGEKAGQTAGTGLGGSVVKTIVEHYKGDYDVFMDGHWTVIRVYLPIAI